ncbi:MAG: hypothetical protein AUI45_02240 [Acidobacteria bacterium 13_1_40CM_2_56_11]|nr:MAG: hypothetical protein AUI45_02240 [Acidobacteria bacterium 13_1_40CM_2_56_11]
MFPALQVSTIKQGVSKFQRPGDQMRNERSRLVQLDFNACFVGRSFGQWTYFLAVWVLFGLSQASVASAQTWTNIGPGSDYVRVVRIDPVTPSTLYAGMVFEGGHYPVGGVFKSIDGGHTWSNSSMGMPTNPNIYSLVIDPKTPSTLYAGNFDGGVYKSVDSGATWAATMSPPLSNPKVYSLAIDPKTTSTVYVGMDGAGLYKSIDGGGTWNAASTGMPANPSIYTIAVDPNTPSTVYAGLDGYGVYKSTDSGAHWSAASRGLPADADIAAIAINPVTPSTLYAATEEISGTTAGWVYISTDSGSTWSPVSTGLPVTACGLHALAIDPVTTSTVYAGEFGCGVYKSTNSGGNWSPLNTGLPDPYVHSIAIVTAAPTTVYAGSCNTGVYVLTQPVGIQSLTISATGAASTSTPGPFGPLITGYVSGTVKAGSAPYATAVFSNTQNGVVVSEAGVPASPPTIAARFFVDSRTKVGTTSGNGTVDILTGFAVANGNSTAANLNLNLRDSNGSTLARGSLQLAAGAHIAKFLDQLAPNFVLPPGFANNGLGSLEITSDWPVSVVALRLTVNQRGDLLLASTPIGDLAKLAPSGVLSFPQIVDGGGLQTTLILMNTSNALETGSARLYGDDGSPLSTHMTGGSAADSSFSYSIPPGGFVRLATDGSPPSVNAGWAQLTPDAGMSAPVSTAIFSLTQLGTLVTESGVPAITSTTHARIYVDKSSGHDTGLAVTNPGESSIRITAAAYQSDGVTPAGNGPGTVDLVSSGHTAKFVGQFIAGLPDGFTGVLDLVSASAFNVVTLRSLINGRGDFLLTTFPVADMNQAPPAPLIFPQIAEGGGYQTQIILLSTSPAASTVTLSYIGDDGSPILNH